MAIVTIDTMFYRVIGTPPKEEYILAQCKEGVRRIANSIYYPLGYLIGFNNVIYKNYRKAKNYSRKNNTNAYTMEYWFATTVEDRLLTKEQLMEKIKRKILSTIYRDTITTGTIILK